jgi:DNA-binding GntR family transcriptional regulator
MRSNGARHSGSDDHLYRELAQDIVRAIEGGALQPGQKVPSVRHLSAQRGVSISTVLQAYRVLENEGLIEAKPQSGYFVRHPQRVVPTEIPTPEESLGDARQVNICALTRQVLRAIGNPDLIN